MHVVIEIVTGWVVLQALVVLGAYRLGQRRS